MRREQIQAPQSTSIDPRVALIVFAMAIAGAAGVYVTVHGFDYRDAMVGAMLITGIAALLLGRRGLRIGYFLWIASFGLGYRTIALSESLRIHPSELIIFALAAWGMAYSIAFQRRSLSTWVPAWLLGLIPFLFWGWWPITIGEDRVPDEMLMEFLNFVLLIPIYLIVSSQIRDAKSWKQTQLAFFAVGLFIAAMGCLEYYVPATHDLLPNFVGNNLNIETQEGFTRAGFSFWGSPCAVYITALALPFVLLLWRWMPGRVYQALLGSSVFIMLLAVYIAGYRSVWLIVAVTVLLYCWMARRLAVGLVLLSLFFVAYQFIPQASQERLHSLTMALQGKPIDSSGIKRLDRATDAWQTFLDNPIGSGWSSLGWVHNDFLMLAVDIGWMGTLYFTICLLFVLARLARRYRTDRGRGSPSADIALALFLSMFVGAALMFFEGVTVLPQLVAPVWLLWALSDAWLRRGGMSQEERDAAVLPIEITASKTPLLSPGSRKRLRSA